jgi:hypothetical protein
MTAVDERTVYHLMLEALEANERVAQLQRPFVAGLNRGSTASHDVKQEAAERLGAAQRYWWEMRDRALSAARARRAYAAVDTENQALRQALSEIAGLATQSVDTRYGGQILRDIEVKARAALEERRRRPAGGEEVEGG